jgi:hypothetical protein
MDGFRVYVRSKSGTVAVVLRQGDPVALGQYVRRCIETLGPEPLREAIELLLATNLAWTDSETGKRERYGLLDVEVAA